MWVLVLFSFLPPPCNRCIRSVLLYCGTTHYTNDERVSKCLCIWLYSTGRLLSLSKTQPRLLQLVCRALCMAAIIVCMWIKGVLLSVFSSPPRLKFFLIIIRIQASLPRCQRCEEDKNEDVLWWSTVPGFVLQGDGQTQTGGVGRGLLTECASVNTHTERTWHLTHIRAGR